MHTHIKRLHISEAVHTQVHTVYMRRPTFMQITPGIFKDFPVDSGVCQRCYKSR